MTVTHEHLAGLKLAMLQWNKGGQAAHFATQLSDLIAQAKAASADPATGTEQVSSTWLAQLREEYLTFGSECQRLTAENARLRQHKTEYMDAAEETRRALAARLAEFEAQQGDLSERALNMVAGNNLAGLVSKLYEHLRQWKPTSRKQMDAKNAATELLMNADHAQQVKP